MEHLGTGHISFLVGGFNPSENYSRQIENLPQIGMSNNNI